MAFEAPSGLMGKPDNLHDFVTVIVDDITFYISEDVLEARLKDNILYIYIEGYGRYAVEFINI